MSVWTYSKVNGEIVSELIDAEALNGQLAAGWTVDKASLDKPVIAKESADTNDSGKLSIEEVRAAAKEANIDGWDTKRKATLEAELWPTPKAI